MKVNARRGGSRRLLCALVVASLAVAAPAVARADVVADWNVTAQNVTATLRPTAHGQTRGIAMVQGAVYDAVNAIDRGHQPYLLDLDAVGAQPWGSQDAAAATAARDMLVALAPAQQAALDAQYTTTLQGIPDGAVENEGVRVGHAAAASMVAARAGDGFMAPFTFDIGAGPGDWRPTGWPFPLPDPRADPDAWVGNLRPFLIESPSQFRSKGPNALNSKAYAKDFDEVKSVGSLTSTTRTADQTYAAIFWQTAQPWSRLARELAVANGLGSADLARLLAMVHLAAADGAIACWNDKYYWQFWRPIAAIHEADTDGNPATVADPAWKSLFDPSTPTTPPLATPPFPDHPSGHGCISGAVLNTFRSFFGKDKMEYDIFSSRFPGQARHFTRFSQALKEIIDARVWGGIHFRTADVQGAGIGKKVARYMEKHDFRAVR